ncbi:MAG: hypothetical protein GY765_24830 [bacterium]|nr:hypothetical protein [bacterium]
MNFLLMTYRQNHYAVNMHYVARVLDTRKSNVPKTGYLLDPAASGMVVLLKNRRLLPADTIEDMVEYKPDVLPLNLLLKGCMTNCRIEGFVLVKAGIYAVLSKNFLKIAKGDIQTPGL